MKFVVRITPVRDNPSPPSENYSPLIIRVILAFPVGSFQRQLGLVDFPLFGIESDRLRVVGIKPVLAGELYGLIV